MSNNYSKNCKVLIENGDLDGIVPPASINEFKEEMDGQGIDWRFNVRELETRALSHIICCALGTRTIARRSTALR